jgi:hypothetical protein
MCFAVRVLLVSSDSVTLSLSQWSAVPAKHLQWRVRHANTMMLKRRRMSLLPVRGKTQHSWKIGRSAFVRNGILFLDSFDSAVNDRFYFLGDCSDIVAHRIYASDFINVWIISTHLRRCTEFASYESMIEHGTPVSRCISFCLGVLSIHRGCAIGERSSLVSSMLLSSYEANLEATRSCTREVEVCSCLRSESGWLYCLSDVRRRKTVSCSYTFHGPVLFDLACTVFW